MISKNNDGNNNCIISIEYQSDFNTVTTSIEIIEANLPDPKKLNT